MAENRMRLRNRLMRQLKEWGGRLNVSSVRCEAPSGNRYRELIIWAVGPRGKTIFIYPTVNHYERIPLGICEEMEEASQHGALVGSAANIGDVWDICIDDEVEYPRKARTYRWSQILEKHRNKGEADGRAEEE
jgi:hypothetical protein